MEQETQTEGTSTEIKDPAAVLAALDRAKQDAKKFRVESETLAAEMSKKDEEIAKFSGKLLREKINQEIAKLNISNTERIVKYLNLNSLSFDDDFNVIGLEEQLEGIKNDFPELFDPKLLVGGKADAGNVTPVDTKLTASQIQAKLVLGR
jgi:hypothetical protein